MSVDEAKETPKAAKDSAQVQTRPSSDAEVRAAAAARTASPKPEKKEEGWRETLSTIGFALLIALVIRSFLFQPFNIPSESMKPTLLVGDYLFVSKFTYGYSRHSLPFSPPLIPGRIFSGAPERGDVIVFKTPRDNRTDFIKRLIGLPGDTIQMKAGILHINGEPVARQRIGTEKTYDPAQGRIIDAVVYQETLPNGASYKTYDLGMRDRDNTDPYVVPAGHYFMMGDNRDNSTDSRVSPRFGGVGFVPIENLVGKAQIIFFSTDGSAKRWEIWRWFTAARYNRMFHGIE